MKKIILLLLVICSSVSLNASHIIGGTVEYTINSVDGDMVNIDVVFHVYRDANAGGAQFDSTIGIGLYGGNGSQSWSYMRSNTVNPQDIETIDFSSLLDCVPASVNMQYAKYETNFQIDMKDYDQFVFAYQRCCRSGSIANILEGGETGIALTVEITKKGMEKLGTVKSFSNIFPVSNLPSNQSSFDFSINDGLTKRYSLSRAKTGGGTDGANGGNSNDCTGITPDPQTCPPPFVDAFYRTDSGEYGLYGEVKIDSFSGNFVSKLSSVGEYLIAVEAESFENGELLSTVYQQFLQVVSMCTPNTNSEEEDAGEVNQEIYPVPAIDMIYISTPLRDILIFDSKGIKVLSQSTFNDNTGIDISDFVAGIYVLVALNEDGDKVVKRFVK